MSLTILPERHRVRKIQNLAVSGTGSVDWCEMIRLTRAMRGAIGVQGARLLSSPRLPFWVRVGKQVGRRHGSIVVDMQYSTPVALPTEIYRAGQKCPVPDAGCADISTLLAVYNTTELLYT